MPGRGLPSQPDAVLRLVRLAILAGVLLLGAAAWVVSSRRPPDAEEAGALRWATVALLTLAAGAVVVFQRQSAATRDPDRRRRLALVAWATAEAPALLGAVVFLVAGDARAYLAGLALLLAAFVLVPGRG